MEYILSTHELTKRYKNSNAVDHVNMKIPVGSIYGFVGKNGAGKTTLIRMITGLIFPTSGNYELYGESSRKGLLNARRKIAGVVETPSIFLDMNARDNLKMQCKVLGIKENSIDAMLDTVKLNGVGNKKVKDFSLGMKQRLGIAIALIGEPDFLLLDEPTNGLDPEGIIEVRELLTKLNREKNITIMISSHILSELSKLATYYGFIDKGRLIQEITADKLIESCRKCIMFTVSDTKELAGIISGFPEIQEYKILSDTAVELYGNLNISNFVMELGKRNIAVTKITEKDDDLESYFIKLVGGNN